MMSQSATYSVEWGGKPLSIQFDQFAHQANASCVVRYGDTVVLVAVTMGSSPKEGIDFLPLTVEYEERLYAAGKIKSSRFVKTEGRPSDEAVLVGRFIDRAIRPLFDQSMRNEVQVVVTTLVFDGENDPDILGLIGASAALSVSNIPWTGPIGAVRVGRVGGEWVLNPTSTTRMSSDLDLSFAGTSEKIIMVEAGAKEVSEETVLSGFTFGQKHLAPVLRLIEEMRDKHGQPKIVLPSLTSEQTAVQTLLAQETPMMIRELFFASPKASKRERAEAKKLLKDRIKTLLTEKGFDEALVAFGGGLATGLLEHEITRRIIDESVRVDGRAIHEIRPLIAEVALLPRVHGSAHFCRGETEVLSVATLGAPGDEQTLDGMETTGKKRYLHHYNFPPYSVGEVKPMRGPGRREIGHGALAEKALLPVLPEKESFPYTVRVVSEVLTSNGSSSMASTCGSTLALMDAGVPITRPVAGIAMGLASESDDRWRVITDLQDLEDGEGGMDFKIAGTERGITAIQMDTKTHGLVRAIVEEAVTRAKEGRLTVLAAMNHALTAPRADLSPYAPRIITLRIPPAKIGEVIGPGGKKINEIIDTTGVQSIDIEDDGLVMITSMNPEGAQQAFDWIRNMTRQVEAGEFFKGKVTRLMDFGAFVEVLPKQEGLVHVSEMAPWRVEKVSDVVQVGQIVHVKVKEIDSLGRINLSMKDAPENTFDHVPKPSGAPRTDGPRGPRPPHHGSPSSRPPFRGPRS